MQIPLTMKILWKWTPSVVSTKTSKMTIMTMAVIQLPITSMPWRESVFEDQKDATDDSSHPEIGYTLNDRRMRQTTIPTLSKLSKRAEIRKPKRWGLMWSQKTSVELWTTRMMDLEDHMCSKSSSLRYRGQRRQMMIYWRHDGACKTIEDTLWCNLSRFDPTWIENAVMNSRIRYQIEYKQSACSSVRCSWRHCKSYFKEE